jgi:hypothetical protein
MKQQSPTSKDDKSQNNVKLQDDMGILADGKIDAADVKHILSSKTVWVNVLAFVAFFLQSKWGYVMDEATQAQVLTVVNIGLRYVTHEPVRW